MTKRIKPVADSNVNRIDGVTLDESGFIHTRYGSYNPVTGEGLPIDAPRELMEEILAALLQDGLDSPIDESFDLDEFMKEMHSKFESENIETAGFFTERAQRADIAAFDRIMNREGGKTPRPGDEIPTD